MRTFLNESFPPQCVDKRTVSSPAEGLPEAAVQNERTFLQTAVLASVDDLVEVGVGGTVIAAPSALHAKEAIAALGRGVAFSSPKAAWAEGSSPPARLIRREFELFTERIMTV